MANTYTLISSTTLTTSQTAINFSNIPNTYTDLVLRMSIRANSGYFDDLLLTINNDDSTNYSFTEMYENNSGTSSVRQLNITPMYIPYGSNGESATANTFSNAEIYIPNYNSNTNKPFSSFSVTESNSTTTNHAFIQTSAHLWRNTGGIFQLKIEPRNTGSFLTNSSFYLYGIKNS